MINHLHRFRALRRRVFLALAAMAMPLCNSGCEAATAQPRPGVASSVPIPFDHTIHAGRYAIPCLSCHAFADKSPVAGIPSLQRCMGCHRFVASDKPAIRGMTRMFREGKSASWPRVYDLPDHVYFTHRMHVRAGLDCSVCHGSVAAMPIVRLQHSLDMGWCVDCHRERGASRDCVTCHK